MLGVTMILLGNAILGNLNKEATSQESLGLAFWRIVIASGIVVIVMGFVNLFSVSICFTSVWSDSQLISCFRVTSSATPRSASMQGRSDLMAQLQSRRWSVDNQAENRSESRLSSDEKTSNFHHTIPTQSTLDPTAPNQRKSDHRSEGCKFRTPHSQILNNSPNMTTAQISLLRIWLIILPCILIGFEGTSHDGLICEENWRCYAALISTMIPCYAGTQKSLCNKMQQRASQHVQYPLIDGCCDQG
jgi:hypothetical protein